MKRPAPFLGILIALAAASWLAGFLFGLSL